MMSVQPQTAMESGSLKSLTKNPKYCPIKTFPQYLYNYSLLCTIVLSMSGVTKLALTSNS